MHFEPRRRRDRLLKAAGAFDGHVSNGGLGRALDVTGENDVEEAVQGLRYFGLQGAARVVVTAMTLEDEGAARGAEPSLLRRGR